MVHQKSLGVIIGNLVVAHCILAWVIAHCILACARCPRHPWRTKRSMTADHQLAMSVGLSPPADVPRGSEFLWHPVALPVRKPSLLQLEHCVRALLWWGFVYRPEAQPRAHQLNAVPPLPRSLHRASCHTGCVWVLRETIPCAFECYPIRKITSGVCRPRATLDVCAWACMTCNTHYTFQLCFCVWISWFVSLLQGPALSLHVSHCWGCSAIVEFFQPCFSVFQSCQQLIVLHP